MFQNTPYGTSERINGVSQLQVEKIFVAIPEEDMDDIGANWAAILWLVLLIVSIGGLIYHVGESFLVQELVNTIVADITAVARLGKDVFADLVNGDLPTVPIMPIIVEQLPLIISGVGLLSLLGLSWAIIAHSTRYKNRCRQMRSLQDVILKLRYQLPKLVAGIQSAIVEMEQTTNDKETLVGELTEWLENHAGHVNETARQARQLQRLGENTQQINKLVDTLGDVAEQINIATLNVSIRAVMAGEAGRGIVVFVKEVQRLVELSNGVANDLNGLIKNRQQDADSEAVFVAATNRVDKQTQEFTAQSTTDEMQERQSKTQWDLKTSQITLVFEQIASITQKLKQSVAEFKLPA